MGSRVDFFTYDHSGEKTGVHFNLRNASSGGEYNNRLAEISALQSALEGVTLASWGNYDFIGAIYLETPSLPSNPFAQREIRALFDCVAANNEQFQVGVPCPDLNDMALPGGDLINLTNIEVAAYVAVLEAQAVSPAGNALTVNSGHIVGVNN